MKILAFLIILCCLSAEVCAQAKKPTIMVVPSRQWCFSKGYYNTVDNFGTEEREPDYRKAFDENPELLLVISKINSLFVDRGFPLKDLSQTLSSIGRSNAEDLALGLDREQAGKGALAESLFDKVRNTAKADILIELQWVVNQSGPRRSITYVMRGLDAYTDKQVAGAEGTGEPSVASETALLLEEAVLQHIDNFNARLMTHFEDLFANGREIKVEFRRDNNWAYNFESDFNGDELSFQIEDWIQSQAVKNRFSTAEATDNKLVFDQVRIPMYEGQRALDARSFGRNIQRFLKSSFNIDTKIVTKGLGYVQLICGQK